MLIRDMDIETLMRNMKHDKKYTLKEWEEFHNKTTKATSHESKQENINKC